MNKILKFKLHYKNLKLFKKTFKLKLLKKKINKFLKIPPYHKFLILKIFKHHLYKNKLN